MLRNAVHQYKTSCNQLLLTNLLCMYSMYVSAHREQLLLFYPIITVILHYVAMWLHLSLSTTKLSHVQSKWSAHDQFSGYLDFLPRPTARGSLYLTSLCYPAYTVHDL